MIRRRLARSSFAFAFAIAFAITVFAGRAAAQEQAAIDKLVQMNKKALDDYDTLEWDSAKKTLLDALVAGKKAGLENHPVMARTYVHLGAVYITGFKNRDKALQSFTRALEIDPAIQLSKGIATGEVNDAFNEAKRARGGGGEPPPAAKKTRKGPVMDNGDGEPAPKKKPAKSSTSDDDSEEKDLPVKIQALDCPNEDEAILDRPATLRCAVAPNLPVAKVFLMYKEPGKEDYTELQMAKSPKGWYVGKIPKKAVTGKSLSYYFEGRNAADKVVVVNGEKGSPNFLLLMEEEAYRARKETRGDALGTGEDTENPLEVDEGPKKQGPLGYRDRSLEGLDVRFGKRKWWIGIGAGSGFGFAKGDGLEAVNRSPDPAFHSLSENFAAGGAWAGLGHLAPELGVMLTPNIGLSVEGRFQYIPQPSKYARFTSQGALSGLVKLMLYTKQSRVRFFGTAIVGGGEGFRFVVKPAAIVRCDGANPDPLCPVKDFQDTVRGGPLIGGAGLGLYYEATKRVSLVLEAHALAGFPIFSFVVDGNLALQFNFYAGGGGEALPPGRYVPKEEDEEPK
jgi:hypothetical protein